MNSCSCGNLADDNGELCRRCAALHVLELRSNATENEIKAAYHVLVKVWHPDRFQVDKSLKETAEAKLKSINAAYVFLSSKESKGGRWQKAKSAPRGPFSKKTKAAAQPPAGEGSQSTTPIAIPVSAIIPALKLFLKFALLILALLLCRYLWIAFDVQDPTSAEVTKVYGYGKDTLLKGLEGPKKRFIAAVEQDLERLDLRGSPQPALPPASLSPAATLQAPDAAPAVASQTTAQTSASKATGRLPARIRSTAPGIRPYVTIGSTKAEVLEQQGSPTAASENKLVYGRSELYLKDGAVTGWKIDPSSSPIRVKLWPQSAVDPSMDFFTVGSTKDDVLVVQGTPTAFSEDKFEYGGSEIYFQDDRVVRWKNDPASIPLRARQN
ncbi:MAG: DnaJ domain-containing protein [Terracidiphilus sp.]|jgi:hypothetical protein